MTNPNGAAPGGEALREAASAVLAMCESIGTFDNGVTDATGSINEGEVIAGRLLRNLREALATPAAPSEPVPAACAESEVPWRYGPELARILNGAWAGDLKKVAAYARLMADKMDEDGYFGASWIRRQVDDLENGQPAKVVHALAAHPAPTSLPLEPAITALVAALVESKGWLHGYADAIVRDAIVRDAIDRRDSLPGEDARDAGRYRELRMHVLGARDARGRQEFILDVDPVGNVMQGSVAQHLDAALDAALAARDSLGGGEGSDESVVRKSRMTESDAPEAGSGEAVEPVWFAVETPGADHDVSFVRTRAEALELIDIAREYADDCPITELFTAEQVFKIAHPPAASLEALTGLFREAMEWIDQRPMRPTGTLDAKAADFARRALGGDVGGEG